MPKVFHKKCNKLIGNKICKNAVIDNNILLLRGPFSRNPCGRTSQHNELLPNGARESKHALTGQVQFIRFNE
jgi:hypothetical protein